ncbi:MAG: DUF3310 domain-containing protein [Veillonella sp.]|uniref:DUF3310 domain-containing protein n=1 Tax=Veillonella sp. TaxID=1926307 RepID=UPI001DC293F6|nr:DUF3310 domain-containing protein [Veillonella sp.]MBS6185565.1 DUF3310 domain-containing protein [Veillonella sp.]
MNTNSKHYEILAIEPWDIMEANFPPEQFVAYLKGNIIKYTLRSKGQDLTDAEKIKHYAEKLIEVLEKKDMDEFLDEDAERIYGDYGYGQEDEPEPVEEPEDEHKFKVGDRVVVYKGDPDERVGTIRRLPMVNKAHQTKYIIELDKQYIGWGQDKDEYGVDCTNGWLASEYSLTLLEPLNEKSTSALIPNLWYDASLYTVEKLKELLPVGTKVIVTSKHDNDREVDLKEETVKEDTVDGVEERPLTNDTRIGLSNDYWFRRYFKIIE